MPANEYDPALDDLFRLIGQYITLSADSRAAFASIAEKREYPKGVCLVSAGSCCKHLFFIQEGLTRTFYIKDGKEVTDWISPEQSLAVSIVSFITGLPDIRSIETLEHSIVWAIGRDDLEQLYRKNHEIERFGRLMVSAGAVQMQQRFDDLHFASARERYSKLMQQSPTLLQRVPLGMIASYLGITQETLSRIRADYTI
ncbi:Crp/Fnr family transcriptional regulator [Chitinophaga arvensicola]|uniref:cAMP-binding domain of CRP or a regulatory subunit of cAMP-dependent protein kinases n=1 Tax=Chitinophaga arvensicola TaxID=29529 RepID=A0A1I0R9X9_9BACT|nr:Crp/Fnr family transcriptional regulator [Chitinophaga arvensicola]SEW37579.1 cAMP-binding domain of CRP or a regulatory subunit of cAMP-dependent protein kinases [Chitinophaga arvensicola]